MTKKELIRKLSSRKFWACLCGFAASLMAMLRFSDDTATLVTSLITSAGCLIAYILSEGYVDASNAASGDGNGIGNAENIGDDSDSIGMSDRSADGADVEGVCEKKNLADNYGQKNE